MSGRPLEEYPAKVGDVFGSWTILALFRKAVRKGRHRTQRRALCFCACGTTKDIQLSTVVEGRSKSCGCGNYLKRAVDPTDRAVRRFHNRIIRTAEKHGRSCTLTPGDVESLMFGTCVYCGDTPKQSTPPRRHVEGERPYAKQAPLHLGIDRVDSSLGYDLGNVVTCCSLCNTAKLNLSLDAFKTHVAKMFNHLCRESHDCVR